MSYKLVMLSVRQFFSEDIQSKTEDIWDVYAFDEESATYCCEITPSRELLFLGTTMEVKDNLPESEREKVHTVISDTEECADPVTYMHVGSLRRLEEERPHLFGSVPEGYFDDDQEELDECETENARWNMKFDLLREGWATGSLQY